MKFLLLLLSFIVSGSHNLMDCNIHPEFSYKLPDGFQILNTLEDNGVLTVVDEFGNGANLYFENQNFSSKDDPFEDYRLEKLEEVKFRDGGYLVRFNNTDSVDPFDSAFYFKKNGNAVYAFLFRDGPSETHGVFEGQIMQIAREIAQGGRHEYVWEDCLGISSGFHADGNFSKS